MNFESSETKINLMRAFAGESQARNRYDISAEKARSDGYFAIAKLFHLTAKQEQAHATVFYNYLKKVNFSDFDICASYPVNVLDTTLEYVKAAQKNEEDEFEKIYSDFSKIAKEEGFIDIANSFEMIAKIEEIHSDRFLRLANEMTDDSLYVKETDTIWRCTNCGFEIHSKGAPLVCPVCSHTRGHFLEKDYFNIL